MQHLLAFSCNTRKIGEDRQVKDYTVELIASWKNYNKPRCLMQLDVISFGWDINDQLFPCDWPWRQRRKGEKEKKTVIEKKSILVDAIDKNNHRVERHIDSQRVNLGGDEWVEKHIPLLKTSGLAGYMDPLDVYLAIEEFFSKEKTAAERIESVGLTDKERIENHGFDAKTSFRGKIERR